MSIVDKVHGAKNRRELNWCCYVYVICIGKEILNTSAQFVGASVSTKNYEI